VSTKTSTRNRNDGLAVSAMFGATLAAVAMTDWPWPPIVGAGFAVLILVQFLRRGPTGANERLPAAYGVGLLGATFAAAALIIRGTPAAVWAGPALGVIAFAGALAYLRRSQDSTGGGGN
jgi:hypothetical protein